MITLNLGEDYEKPLMRRMEIEQLYRNVFSSAEGRRVLGDILANTCHFGVPMNTEKEMHEYNVGVTIARMSGVMSDIDRQLGIGDE